MTEDYVQPYLEEIKHLLHLLGEAKMREKELLSIVENRPKPQNNAEPLMNKLIYLLEREDKGKEKV